METEPLIQAHNSRRSLVRQHHRPGVVREPFGRAHLILPREAAGAVSRKFHIVRRVSINKIFRLKWHQFQITIAEGPRAKESVVRLEILQVVYRFVLAERHIELAASIETTETVKARPIEVIEELRCFGCCGLALPDQFIEPFAISVENLLAVFCFDSKAQSALNLRVEVYEMLVDVIQQSRLRP